ncbi:hypothetical protein [Celeribacter naphthalenivorans]|uniref:hypothetical protein n=1 Tax=Celeribacter naphthalenivorans TaxID=1614694 RepID=UPI001CFA3793|nr:hypothetical protein [Celeribacter naphthalenivorans]
MSGPNTKFHKTPANFEERFEMAPNNEIEATQSHWLRQAKADLLQRDPVDAVNDAEALVVFAQKRLAALLPEDSN